MARNELVEPLIESAPVFAADQGVLAWRHWEDEWVVHDSRTAATHLLSSSAGLVLEGLLTTGKCFSRRDIWRNVFTEGPEGTATEEPTAEEEQALEALLSELMRLGLVELRDA